MITEMDAARGLAVMPSEPEEAPAGRARRLRIGRGGRSKGRDAATYGQSPDRSSRSSRVDEDPSELHPDDVPDPHVLGTGLHALAYEQITTSTEALVRLLREVGAAG